MSELATKGQGTAAVTLSGITAGLQLLNNHGGLLGGLGGANGMAAQAAGCVVNDKLSNLESEIARLRAEKYTDQSDGTLRNSLLTNWLKPLADEAARNMVNIEGIRKDVAANKEIAELQVKLAEERCRTEHAKTNGAIALIDQRLHCVESKLDSVGSYKIRNTGVCPGWGDVTITPTPVAP